MDTVGAGTKVHARRTGLGDPLQAVSAGLRGAAANLLALAAR